MASIPAKCVRMSRRFILLLLVFLSGCIFYMLLLHDNLVKFDIFLEQNRYIFNINNSGEITDESYGNTDEKGNQARNNKIMKKNYCEKWEYDAPNYTLIYYKERTKIKDALGQCSYPHNETVKKIIRSSGDIIWKGCTQKTARCPENPYFDYKRNVRIELPPCCRQHLMDMLRALVETLDKFLVVNFLASGGVIGWYRNRNMVPYDPEFDIYIDGKIWKSEKWDSILKVLTTEFGYHYEYLTSNKMKLFYSKRNNLTIDIWPYYIDQRSINTIYRKYIIVKDIYYTPVHISNVFPLKQDKLGDVPVYIPQKTKEYLDETYGPGKWEVPYKCTKFKWGECIE